MIGGARRLDDEPGRIRVAHEIVDIDALRPEKLVNERADESAVRAGPDADPFVSNGVVARAHGIDGDDLRSVRLELAETDLDRVRAVVLGNAEEHEEFRVVPVRLAELPERAAERVEAGGRHVHRAEAAVGCVVRRAVLDGPPAGQRLRLVAAREEGELLRVLGADLAQPVGGRLQRFFPGDLLELARAARTDALERRFEARRRVVLHDAGGALAAQHALVHRVIAVAVDVTDLAVLEIDVDPAPAGAHVAGRLFDPVSRVFAEDDAVCIRLGCPGARGGSLGCRAILHGLVSRFRSSPRLDAGVPSELRNQKGHQNHGLASVIQIEKFAPYRAA